MFSEKIFELETIDFLNDIINEKKEEIMFDENYAITEIDIMKALLEDEDNSFYDAIEMASSMSKNGPNPFTVNDIIYELSQKKNRSYDDLEIYSEFVGLRLTYILYFASYIHLSEKIYIEDIARAIMYLYVLEIFKNSEFTVITSYHRYIYECIYKFIEKDKEVLDDDYLENVIDEIKNYSNFSNNIYSEEEALATENKSNDIAPTFVPSDYIKEYNVVDNKDEILYRDDVIWQVYTILSKQKNKNILIIGDGGVGKKSIIRQLALKIKYKKCPENLMNKKLITIDINSILQEPNSIFYIKNFIMQNGYDVILLVEDIHEKFRLSNELLPFFYYQLEQFLYDTSFSVIITTTKEFYLNHKEDYCFFCNLFEKIYVDTLDDNKQLNILQQKVKKLEEYHNVTISKDILKEAYYLYLYLSNNCNNLSLIIDNIDKLMAVAKLNNQKKVTKKTFKMLYKEKYDEFNQTLK